MNDNLDVSWEVKIYCDLDDGYPGISNTEFKKLTSVKARH